MPSPRLFLITFLFLILLSVPLASQETTPSLLPQTQPQTLPETQPETRPAAPDMPEFQGIDQWFNSSPLTRESLKGKVVLIDFWTYSCINCLRTIPTLKNWYQRYKGQGFVIIGVHSPEFDFERDPANVKMAVERLQIPYPVALDSRMATWTAFNNNVWPAHYFVDARGKVRHVHFGEGDTEKSEEVIRMLLAEAAPKKAEVPPATKGKKKGRRPETPPKVTTAPPPQQTLMPTPPQHVDFSQIKSPETYLGFLRRERLVTSGRPIELNEWMFEGAWRTEGERLFLKEGTGRLRFRFFATKVNLVIHPGTAPVQAVVRLDGQPVPPGKGGVDLLNGNLLITQPRMYELINLGVTGEEHTVEIEFLTPGVAVYAFTFG